MGQIVRLLTSPKARAVLTESGASVRVIDLFAQVVPSRLLVGKHLLDSQGHIVFVVSWGYAATVALTTRCLLLLLAVLVARGPLLIVYHAIVRLSTLLAGGPAVHEGLVVVWQR